MCKCAFTMPISTAPSHLVPRGMPRSFCELFRPTVPLPLLPTEDLNCQTEPCPERQTSQKLAHSILTNL